MSSVPFHYLDLRTFCYETEAERRVTDALETFLPDDTDVERTVTEGHHNDRIVVLAVRVERAQEMRHILNALSTSMKFEGFVDEVADRVNDDCAFFLRLDKQRAYRGDIAPGDGIQLRGKVEAYPAKRANAIDNLRTYLSE